MPVQTYEDAIVELGENYAEFIDAVKAELGLTFEPTQTGGMCGALYAPIEGGYLHVYDLEESLSWDVRIEDGLCVTRFEPLPDFPLDAGEFGPARLATHHMKTPRVLVDLVRDALRPERNCSS